MSLDDGSQLDVFGGIAYAGAYGDSPSTAFGTYDGGYVTVWAGDEGQGQGIYSQHFSADGTANGSPALLTDPSLQSGYSPSVAVSGDGMSFAVTWVAYSAGASYEIYAEAFYLDGTPIYWMPSMIGSSTGARPTIVADPALAGYAAVWTAYDTAGTGSDVYVRRLNYYADPTGNAVQVNADSDNYRYLATSGKAAGADAAGNLVVAWQDGSGPYGVPQLKGRVLDVFNQPRTGEFLIAEAQSYMGGAAAVSVDAATGNFVAVWDELTSDGTAADVYVQRYNALAAPLGERQQVNSSAGMNHSPAVAFDGEQRIGVTWTTYDENGGTRIQARWFDAAGEPATDEVLVNAVVGTGYGYGNSAIAADASGNFAVAWSVQNTGTTSDHVFQRQYSLETIDVFTEITVSQNTAPVVIDLRQYFDGNESLTFTLEGNDNEALTFGTIDGWLLTLDVTADLSGMAGLTICGTDGVGAFSDVLLTLIVNPAV